MKLKDVIKIITAEGGVAVRKEEIIELGFVYLEEETFKWFGKFYWKIHHFEYEAEIEPVLERKPFETFYTEGLTKIMEIPVFGYYTYIYRAVPGVYLIHISTGPYKQYYRIWIYDNEGTLIAKTEVGEGFLILGDQRDLENVLPKLFKILDPAKIKIY
jgi:hypothetical protein